VSGKIASEYHRRQSFLASRALEDNSNDRGLGGFDGAETDSRSSNDAEHFFFFSSTTYRANIRYGAEQTIKAGR